MSRQSPMGEHEERRLRDEMADWSDSKLTAAEIKEPGFARGIAARQIQARRRANGEVSKHKELLREIKTPHWSVTPSFVLLVITLLLSLAAVVLAALALPQVQLLLWPSSPTQASAPGSQPAQNHSRPESRNSARTQPRMQSASAPAFAPPTAPGK